MLNIYPVLHAFFRALMTLLFGKTHASDEDSDTWFLLFFGLDPISILAEYYLCYTSGCFTFP